MQLTKKDHCISRFTKGSSPQINRKPCKPFIITKRLCSPHWTASYLLFQELFTGFVEGASFFRHKQILFLKGVQVLQSSADIFQNSITLFLVAVQLIPGFPAGKEDI